MAAAQWTHLYTFQFDQDYLQRLRARDSATEEHFIAFFAPRLKIKLRQRHMCPELIKDVQQETFLRVLMAVRSPSGIRQPESLGGFVNSVCNNILRELGRYNSRHQALEDMASEPTDKAMGPDEILADKQSRNRALKAFLRMPAKHQQILRAVFLQEKHKDEVCRDLGISRGYLRVLLYRARQQFHTRNTTAFPAISIKANRLYPVRAKKAAQRPGAMHVFTHPPG
jgi:RNA polymerase sigma-70 factor (ECF subfamily)